ncbi:hypothetical protein [Microbacterium sp. CIAB417]|uniref:hypothetical protein n=1 Tax=Microbacterium sp. CIAB417 TaxID=2860287 RepID=UPI001FAD7470|nr:hypothetical protein [Microbacterium sp. CIAB417]
MRLLATILGGIVGAALFVIAVMIVAALPTPAKVQAEQAEAAHHELMEATEAGEYGVTFEEGTAAFEGVLMPGGAPVETTAVLTNTGAAAGTVHLFGGVLEANAASYALVDEAQVTITSLQDDHRSVTVSLRDFADSETMAAYADGNPVEVGETVAYAISIEWPETEDPEFEAVNVFVQLEATFTTDIFTANLID